MTAMTEWRITMVQLGRELSLMRAVRLDSKNSARCILHIFLGIFHFAFLLAPIPKSFACSDAKAVVFVFLVYR
jgi:hypothetical protein